MAAPASGSFNNNTWYQINWKYGSALMHSPLYVQYESFAYGSAYLSPYDWMKWQFIPSPQNTSQFVIRPAELGVGAWLGSAQKGLVDAACQNDCSETGLFVTNRLDASSLWTVSQWDDSSYYFSNNANGSDWLLSVDGLGPGAGSWLNMGKPSTNRTIQQWNITSIGLINDVAYSTMPPSLLSPSTPSSQVTQTFSGDTDVATTLSASALSNAPSKSPPQVAHSMTSIPTNAASFWGAIGGAAAGAVMITALFFTLLWHLRRRRSVYNGGRPELGGTSSKASEKALPNIPEFSSEQERVEAPSQEADVLALRIAQPRPNTPAELDTSQPRFATCNVNRNR